MHTTLSIDESTLKRAAEGAARCGETVIEFLDKAVEDRLRHVTESPTDSTEFDGDDLGEAIKAMQDRTSHFRIGPKPTRDEMNER